MTKRDAHQIKRWFQRAVIGLLGWNITFVFGLVPEKDEGNPSLGACKPDLPYHTAVIYINPKAHETQPAPLDDPAETLMHELLHVFHCECGIIDDGERAEYAVNQLASILLKQYRADTK